LISFKGQKEPSPKNVGRGVKSITRGWVETKGIEKGGSGKR